MFEGVFKYLMVCSDFDSKTYSSICACFTDDQLLVNHSLIGVSKYRIAYQTF